MATSSLPAGFSITTINGKRCTAVPRAVSSKASAAQSVTTTSAAAAAASTTAAAVSAAPSPPPPAPAPSQESTSTVIVSTTSSPQQSSKPVNVAPARVPTVVVTNTPAAATTILSTTASVTPVAATPASSTEAASTPDPEPSSTPAAAAPISSTPVESTLSTEAQTAAATSTSIPAPTPTSPPSSDSVSTTVTQGSQTSAPIAQSEITQEPSSTSTHDPAIGHSTDMPVTSTAQPALALHTTTSGDHSSTTNGISDAQNFNAGPLVGGIVAGVAVIMVLSFFLWWYRRKHGNRNSRSINWDTEKPSFSFYEIDGASVGPTRRTTKWKASANFHLAGISASISNVGARINELGSAIKTKVKERGPSPGVNMNRGNSQFLGDNRQNRAITPISEFNDDLTTRERLANWWRHLSMDAFLNWRLRKSTDEQSPYNATRNMGAGGVDVLSATPAFKQYLSSKDMEQRQASNPGRRSLSMSDIPPLHSTTALGLDFSNPTTRDPFADPKPTGVTRTLNPFMDPITEPKPLATTKSNQNPIADIRRSRGQSIATPSRQQSMIRFSKDSYRDTMFSNLTRKGKGRSDPFDLENHDLWASLPAMPDNATLAQYNGPGNEHDSLMEMPAGTSYTSKYSSGVSGMFSEWGDPGPDLGASPKSTTGGVGKAM